MSTIAPLDAALAYAAKGWHVFPCHTPTKTGCSCRRADCANIGKHPRTQNGLKDATTDEATIRRWWKMWPAANVAIRTGAVSGLVVLDEDTYKGGDHSRIDLELSYSLLPETAMQLTGGGGVQYFFAHPGVAVKNGVGTLGVGLDVRGDGGYVIAPPSLHKSGERYVWEVSHDPDEMPLAPMPPWLLALCQETTRGEGVNAGDPIPSGQRNATLFHLGCSMRAKGFAEAPILAALQAVNATQCFPPEEDAAIVALVAELVKRYPAGTSRASQNGNGHAHTSPLTSASSPFFQREESLAEPITAPDDDVSDLSSLFLQGLVKIRKEAFYGIAGEFVQTILPHSEADPVGLLMQFLVKFGTLVGRRPYFTVESTRHYPNTFAVLVGLSSKARKGTAHDNVEYVMHSIDPSWTSNNVIGGCGSGEGLINAVRDPTMKRNEDVVDDPGVTDKRLLVHEPEFASVLKVASRDGNILSMTLRQAWDSGNLQNSVKTCPQKATNAHVSVIGHITVEELKKLLTATDATNGFANRFLWVYVERSKLLPDGGTLSGVDMRPLQIKIRTVYQKAIAIERMERDSDTRIAWHAVYERLSTRKPGLSGSILARAEAQVLRLSMLYALLDGSRLIRTEHLYAALAIWEYVETSVLGTFGSATGDKEADVLYEALRGAPEGKISRWDIIKEVFHGRIKASELNEAIRTLADAKIVRLEYEKTAGRRKTYVCYDGGQLYSPLMRARGGYIEQARLAVEESKLCDIPQDCKKREERSESHSYGLDTDDEPQDVFERKAEEAEESPHDPMELTFAPCLHLRLDTAGRCRECGEYPYVR